MVLTSRSFYRAMHYSAVRPTVTLYILGPILSQDFYFKHNELVTQ